jgi:hypothetical protein
MYSEWFRDEGTRMKEEGQGMKTSSAISTLHSSLFPLPSSLYLPLFPSAHKDGPRVGLGPSIKHHMYWPVRLD